MITNLPDTESAQKLARALVERQLAACVSLLSPCQSVFRWQGRMDEATEIPLFIKTTSECYGVLETAIRALHPYELPEIIAVSIERGLPEYLRWVATETSAENATP